MVNFLTKFLVCIVLVLWNNDLYGQNKIALLVGVSNYASHTGWEQLSASNDLDLVKDALLRQGFEVENIHLLQNEKATKEGVLQSIQTKLIEQAKKGSIVVFHYSGHGQQMQDNNGDELDGLDEALVPYDSNKYFVKGEYEGEKLIRDDDLGELFYKLRQKIGSQGQFLVLMDACHSGTGTRGLGAARGTNVKMASPGYLEKWKQKSDANRTESTIQNGDIAPVISFFSSRAGQLSYERRGEDGKGYGLLSYAFSKAFSEASKETSYRALFDEIRLDIQSVTSIQSPQAEGLLDVPLMDNKILGKANYFEVQEAIDASTVLIKGGTLHGIYEGTKIGFYPFDTRDITIQQPYAVGTVIYSNLIEADVEFEKTPDLSQIQKSWAYVIEKNYGHLKVNMQLEIEELDLKNAWLETYNNDPIVNVVESNPDVLLKKEGNSWRLISKDGQEFASFQKEMNKSMLHDKLLGYAQASYLRKLEINNPLLKVKIAVKHNGKLQQFDEQPSYMLGDDIELVITNVGEEGFYFSLLDIMPDNSIAAVDLSNGKYTPEELFLKPGATFVSAVMQVGEPIGVDVFKLVTSTEPMDLSVIRGTALRSGNFHNPFEELLICTNTTLHTRGKTTNIPTSFEINVATLIFEIQSK